MVERIIELSVRHKWVVFGATLVLALFAADSARKTPLDALPDLSDPQVIIYTEWMGRSPDLVEDQITYPLVRALQSTPGVQTVRGYSMFGMSFTSPNCARCRISWSARRSRPSPVSRKSRRLAASSDSTRSSSIRIGWWASG
jgi:hypothetical protein